MARQVRHPFDSPATVPPLVAEALWRCAIEGPSVTMAKRESTISWYAKVKKELAHKEANLHAKLPQQVEEIVANKAILLFKRMLEDVNYDDIDVHTLLITGVKLIGTIPSLPFWQTDNEKAPKITPDMLWADAKRAQAEVLARGGSGNDQWDKELWELTMEEAEGKGLEGPFTASQISDQLGKLWVPSRRFGVRQGGKLRPIDDFSEHGINAAFGSGQKVSMKGVDDVVTIAKARLESASDDGGFSVQDDGGVWWNGQMHAEWMPGEWCTIVGRVADLKSAYKQLPIHPAHSALSVVSITNEHGGTSFFRGISLMFGTTAAVYAFLRFSRALAFLGAKLLGLSMVEFFDDFSQVECHRLAESAQKSMEALLGLLGWVVADSEAKRKPFHQTFVSLGVELDFAQAGSRKILLRNKPGRVESIGEMCDALLAPGAKMGFKEALSLRGKVSFAEGQTHAKLSAPLARLLANWSSIRIARPLSAELRLSMECAIAHLRRAGPRVVGPISLVPPCLIFVDGACEEFTSFGAVLVDPLGPNEFFGGEVSQETVDSWKSRLDQKQVIGQAELFPLIVSRLTWAKRLARRKVIFFLDNESARICAIKSYSPVLSSLDIIMQCIGFDYQNEVSAWYARVPTCCNIADGPSRMDAKEAVAILGAVGVIPVCPPGISLANVLS